MADNYGTAAGMYGGPVSGSTPGSRFADMSQFENGGRLGDDTLEKRINAQNQKQREFNSFVRELTTTCFSDCVLDFNSLGGGMQGRALSQGESTCIYNCARQTMAMHHGLGSVMDDLN